jgi:hypothetical protein
MRMYKLKLFQGGLRSDEDGKGGMRTGWVKENADLPEPTDHTNPRGNARRFNLSIPLDTTHALQILLTQLPVLNICAVVVGHHVRDSCFRCCGHQLTVRVWWSLSGESNDEELLALEGRHDGSFVIIVYSSDLDAVNEFACALFASYRCHGVFAGFEEGFGKALADITSSLEYISAWFEDGREIWLTPTMATLSMRLMKPAGWPLAYFGTIVLVEG